MYFIRSHFRAVGIPEKTMTAAALKNAKSHFGILLYVRLILHEKVPLTIKKYLFQNTEQWLYHQIVTVNETFEYML